MNVPVHEFRTSGGRGFAVNTGQQETLLATFEQAGVAKVRKAIGSDHWPREVQDLAAVWLSGKEDSERRSERFEREQMEMVRSSWDTAQAANALAEDARTLARDASISARTAANTADQSERGAKMSNIIAAAALAVSIAALIAAAWPR